MGASLARGCLGDDVERGDGHLEIGRHGAGRFEAARIAADDDSETIRAVFQESLLLEHHTRLQCQENGILMLKLEDSRFVNTQLYGHPSEIPLPGWT